MRVAMILITLITLAACSEQGTDSESTKSSSVTRAEQRVQAGETESEARTGKAIFEHWCLPCHDAGPGHPGTMALAARYGEERSVILERQELTTEYIKYVVRNGFNMMPPMKPTEVSDDELNRLAAYVVSSPKAD